MQTPYKIIIKIEAERLGKEGLSVKLECDTPSQARDWPMIIAGILASINKGFGKIATTEICLAGLTLFNQGQPIDMDKFSEELKANKENLNNN